MFSKQTYPIFFIKKRKIMTLDQKKKKSLICVYNEVGVCVYIHIIL